MYLCFQNVVMHGGEEPVELLAALRTRSLPRIAQMLLYDIGVCFGPN